jgi:flagellar protein FlaG
VFSSIYRKGRIKVTSEINQISSGGLVIRPGPTSAQTMGTPHKHAAVTTLPSPKVDLPLPAKSNGDANEVRNNVKEAVSFLNEQLTANNRGIGFTVNAGSSTPIVTVRNTQTGEVVRQIPNEVVVRVAHSIEKMKGLMFNSKT